MNFDSSPQNSDPFATTRTGSISSNADGNALSTVVEDIVIPHHLVATASGVNRRSRRDATAFYPRPISWNHRKSGQGNIWNLPHAQTDLQTQRIPPLRSNSVSIADLSQGRARGYDHGSANEFAVQGRRRDGLRKTSLPMLIEKKEATFSSGPAYAPDSNELIERYRNAVMFRSINAFSFNRASFYGVQSEGLGSISIDAMHPRQSIDQDPLTIITMADQPHAVTCQNTLLERASTIVRETQHTLQHHRASIAVSFRRTSLWAAYENAKVRGKKMQRQRWAQLLWEYSIYTILLSFVYFVLIGLPLWRGVVYWLYWVFDHKFVVRGTFSITLGIAVM